MLRIYAVGRLASGTDIESMRLGNVDMLLGIFRDARPDDREVLFVFASGIARVDERVAARDEIAVAHSPLLEAL
jgi:hypothetical protein